MNFIDRILPAPLAGGFQMVGYWVWCGSVIKGEDGLYHMFAARWPNNLPFFTGYVMSSEVVRAVSDSPEGPFHFQEVVLADRGEAYWDGRMAHNPTICKYGDTYLLFYIGSCFKGERPDGEILKEKSLPVLSESYNQVRIGLATSKSVFGPWERPNKPILEPRPGKWDSSVVTNPAPCILKDGSIYLYYRSNTPEGLKIGLTKAENFKAPFIRMKDGPVISFKDNGNVEDPFVWQNGEHFEMIAKDMTGSITGEKHGGIHAISIDGMDWKLANPPMAYSRNILWEDGSRSFQGSLERPQLLFQDGEPTHMFAATADGPGGFDSATKTWNMVIPMKTIK